MNCNLKFHKQINNLCKSSYYFLCNIQKISNYLTKGLTATLVAIWQLHCCKISLYDS